MLNFRDLLGVDLPEPDCCTIGSNERRRGGATRAASVRQAYTDHDLIRGLSFSLVRGAIGWLLGSSGCGKTTVLRRIARFEPASDGEILLHGQVVTRRGLTVAPEKRRIGMVFQHYALFPHLSVAESACMVSRVENRAMTRTMRREFGNLGEGAQSWRTSSSVLAVCSTTSSAT
jgi:ABC-type transporter Mla maintaining outer membrane lipid asymmetry ATPase subunit MlaF